MIFVYQFNEDLGEFEELEREENVALFELLHADKIFLFVDVNDEKVWVWEGKNTPPRMRFISAQAALEIRNKHDITFTISSVDDGNETATFKILVGLI